MKSSSELKKYEQKLSTLCRNISLKEEDKVNKKLLLLLLLLL
jgi:hypothetical protein